MGEDGSATWPHTLIGTERDAAMLADHARRGCSVLIAGPRGSGRSHLLRAVAAELERTGDVVVTVTPSTALSDVPYGALTATGHHGFAALRDGSLVAAVQEIVIIDDVEALDVDSARAIARSIASRGLTAVMGLRRARARAAERADGSRPAHPLLLDLWLEGCVHRVDLVELSDTEAFDMIDLLPDAEVLDSVTLARLVWCADGSRTLLRHLAADAIDCARQGIDPLTAARTIAPGTPLAVALERHVAEFSPADLECLATVRRLPHLEFAVATRLFDAEIVEALVGSGRLHADASVHRLLTANDLIAAEAQRQLGAAHVDALVRDAGRRMVAESDEWWSPAIAVAISERWHRLGIAMSGEGAYSPGIRARIALDAAREANSRGDTAHAAAHAARGLRAVDDPALHLEADLAAYVSAAAATTHPVDIARTDVRRTFSRPMDAAGTPSEKVAAADARVDAYLRDAADAVTNMDAAAFSDAAARALAEDDASPSAHLRALTAASAAAVLGGQWQRAQEHHRRIEALLDARPGLDGVGLRDRLAATTSMLAAHPIAGADGAAMRQRLEYEVRLAAREGNGAELAIAGATVAIAFLGSGRPEESLRELRCAVLRDPSAVWPVHVAMIELGVAEELAIAGRPEQARALLRRVAPSDAPLFIRSRLYVETTVLAAEGRFDEARRAARATADLSRGISAAALRVRDLSRLVMLGGADEREVDELVQLAATTDLPLAVTAVRLAAAGSRGDDGLPVDELRLHALWSSKDSQTPRSTTEPTVAQLHPVPAPAAEELTAREQEIAVLANEGLTNRQIAARLFLSIRTVESHIYQARMKVGARSRRELGHLVARSLRSAGKASRGHSSAPSWVADRGPAPAESEPPAASTADTATASRSTRRG